ncbi:chorismate--pyruvate lyase family protein [Marinobacter caseinilyticus]|uniref:chorismate--pyruvate lyase family protein n=1 Tax=Marinobacter caseinilyticus TaxID=2692195 RepID=UPI00140BA09A|nr:chorismate lyase [Marinobacter caseinilyticus]
MRSKDFNSAAAHSRQAIPATQWFPTLAAAGLSDPLVHGPARYWLTLEGSLTRALQVRCRTSFQVNVLSEGFFVPTREEARSLGIPSRQRAWIRQVQLCGDGQPWVLARTIIPRATLKGRGRRLRHLGRKPLGGYLFSRPEWQRGAFQTGLCQTTDADSQPQVARRSRFQSGPSALLVGEYFLPVLL